MRCVSSRLPHLDLRHLEEDRNLMSDHSIFVGHPVPKGLLVSVIPSSVTISPNPFRVEWDSEPYKHS
jgi:hypothetical protein